MSLRLCPRADLATFYEADAHRYLQSRPQLLELVTREVFMAFYADCPSIGFEYDGRPIGGMLFDGRRGHIAVLPQFHGRWALLFKPALEWLFSLQREIVVGIEVDNAKGLAFMDRHRWPRVGVADGEVLYRMTPLGGRRKAAYEVAARVGC